MSTPPQAVLEKLKKSISSGDLIVIIGSGVSIGLTNNSRPALSWKGLIEDGLQHCVYKGKATQPQSDIWKGLLNSDDIDDMLGAAEFIGRKLGAPNGDLYARWLEAKFEDNSNQNTELENAISQIKQSGTPICTLNYDSLLEKITALPEIHLGDLRKSSEWMRRETSGIFHLHGHWTNPRSCVLGIRDYADTVTNEVRGLIQKHLSAFSQLLFIGCGDTFNDPNFSALIAWLKSNMQSTTPQHYALVTDSQYLIRHADESWHGFVEPLSYGASHSELPSFVSSLFENRNPLKGKRPSLTQLSTTSSETLIDDYKKFLIRDCGQMTIEGLRADMDTAQRRFDLEKLFVPLQLEACPPDIPESDPEKSEKLESWLETNSEPSPFGEVFEKTKGLALLALPGGGKTLLLKRLAVAYASPSRRTNSDDKLPDIDIVPILIRCREWRDYIHLPILTIFKKFGDITGQPNLSKFSTAIIPRLKSGKVLLLIDGLDEIHDNANREIFVDNLQKFLTDYPKIRIVVTSREAGFSLVAAKIAGFCTQWRVAPLNKEAIQTLSLHWHKLMTQESAETEKDGIELADYLYQNSSLRRLAENPLLLTMLLVVKHGAGKLPPNRVSLYGRAVDVLMDTWNIKGHEPLNTWESVPQLAYIALELMQNGVQTATEKELLSILDRARTNVPLIARYAKDTPYEFLKRVELRSSLLLEAGHQVENGVTVPFYQFRHLTFQEYLASVALVEGHYDDYKARDFILKPITKKILSDVWKEVIPMAAVLAGKQANPIAALLIARGKTLYKKAIENKTFPGSKEWSEFPWTLPPPISRLLQIFIEEAQIESQVVAEALQLIVYFAKGCGPAYDWQALARGPYASEIKQQIWQLYEPMTWNDNTLIKNTYATFSARGKTGEYFNSDKFYEDTRIGLNSDEEKEQCNTLMTYIGSMWHDSQRKKTTTPQDIANTIESLLAHTSTAVSYAATWCWALITVHSEDDQTPNPMILNLLLQRLISAQLNVSALAAFAISTCAGLKRNSWKPILSDDDIAILSKKFNEDLPSLRNGDDRLALLVISFHSRQIYDTASLVLELVNNRSSKGRSSRVKVDAMLAQLGPLGQKSLDTVKIKEDRRKERVSQRNKETPQATLST